MLTRTTSNRPGFTLVELLVVIAIIGVLLALVTVAGYKAILTVQEHTITIETNQLESAIEAYKAQYGDYPPDFSNAIVVNSHLKKLFPRHKETPLKITQLTQEIDPSEALVYWLGGGLFDNPEYPLSGPGQPKKFFDFKTDRLVNYNNDVDIYPQYVPKYGDQKIPYVYFDSRTYGIVSFTPPTGTQGVARPYLADAGTDQALDIFVWEEPTKFQIVAAGLDGHYGDLPPGATGTPPGKPYKQYPSGVYYTKQDRDNVTSFAEGDLEARLP